MPAILNLLYTRFACFFSTSHLTKKHRKDHHNGFTMIELLISITIISLTILGIMSAKQIQRKGELSQIIDIVGAEKFSFNSFFDLYGAFPGDFAEASMKLPATALSELSVESSTDLNGNGDYIYEDSESLNYWKHLSLEGFTRQNFDGTTWNAGGNSKISTTGLPRGPTVRSALFPRPSASPWGTGTVSLIYSQVYDANENGDVEFTANTLDNERAYSTLTASEGLHLDTKYDDGLPDEGDIRAYNSTEVSNGSEGNCITGSSFNENEKDPSCFLELRIR